MRDKDLGFDADQLAIVEVNGAGVRSNYQQIKHELLNDPSIVAVTGLTRMISGYRTGPRIRLSKQGLGLKEISSGFYGMAANGPAVLGFDFLAGSTFSDVPQQDSSSIILNRAAAESLGGVSIVGEVVTLKGDNEDALTGTVIGVVENFHTQSLHEEIGPVAIGYLSNPFQGLDDIVIKIDGKNTLRAIEVVEAVHHKYDENDVITLEFLDDMVQRSYTAESDFRNLLIGASVIGIAIAILGIIGLTAYLSETRSKEIGIRKILGASLKSILLMQSRSFVALMAIAVIVTCPLIWLLAKDWLSNYAYRIQLTPDIFFLTVILLLLMATATIILISLRTITRNPAETLRAD
jgi:putative ABC transport system permease protein